MHAVGLHSALAINRQRKRRDEQHRAEERRNSCQSNESGLILSKESVYSLNKSIFHRKINPQKFPNNEVMDSKVVTSIGMIHIGIVFLVLGIFLFISGILPNDLSSREIKVPKKWWNELVTIGIFSLLVGSFLIILNRIIAKREEHDLETYVECQLTRSKSGNILERDLETGTLNTKCVKNLNTYKNINSLVSIPHQIMKNTQNLNSLDLIKDKQLDTDKNDLQNRFLNK